MQTRIPSRARGRVLSFILLPAFLSVNRTGGGWFSCLGLLPEHIFNKYPVSFRGIIDKHMSHGADDPSVLDDRTS